MKKILLAFISVISVYAAAAQGTLLHTAPNTGWQNQSLLVTITGQGTTFQSSSPSGPQNIHLIPQSGGSNIFGSIWTVLDDEHVQANFYIPSAATLGVYDLSMDVWFNFSWYTITLTNAFLVTPSDGFLSGSVYYDLNGNGIKNAGEPQIPNSRVLETPDNYQVYTDQYGNYKTGVYNGTYSLQYLPNPNDIVTSVSSYTGIVINNNTDSLNDFGVQYPPGYDSLKVTVGHGILRCNTGVTFTVTAANHCGHVMNGRLYFIKDPLMTYSSSVPVPDFISGDSLYWNITGLGIMQSFVVNPVFVMPSATGTMLSYTVKGDVWDAGNNVVYTDGRGYREVVRCSMDPNDKAVDPPGEQAQNYTLFSDELRYTIRFQNTGNDTAFRVTILDTLDADLDLNTFNFVTSSHPVSINLNPANGALDFTFYNILLPDSNVNEPMSHGYVVYSIRTQTGLPANTIVNNTSYIYFDWNAPVVTNTTMNTMVYVIPVGISENAAQNGIIIYPNPFDDSAILTFENANNEDYTFVITDITGRQILQQKTTESKIVIQKSNVGTGMYFYRLSAAGSNKNFTGKIMIR
jgi:uncharacterized repeat protein (TIGR01451 family)